MLDPQILARPGTVLLDTARPDPSNRGSWCFAGPDRILTASSLDEVEGLLSDLQDVTASGRYVAGFLSYEAGYSFVDLSPPPTSTEPVAWFGVYDHPHPVAPSEVDLGLSSLQTSSTVENAQFGGARSSYIESVEQIRHHIGEGDVYQINYTAPVRFRHAGDSRVLYRRLRTRQHVPFGAYLNLGARQILSCSPELFFRQTGERLVTRPMKGTIRRGRTLDEDQTLREQLAADPKNKAENLMIVDLLRNDLSVCCEPGSVQVPELFATEPYDTVTQMTSTVEGRLRPNQGLPDILRALFPSGSVTGAPKRRAMRLIQSLEAEPRGVYCGAIGMAGPNSAVFSVPIRTVVLEGEAGRMGVGSGIVWDSKPDSEYEECELKTQFLSRSAESPQMERPDEEPRLIETMRFDGLRFPLLDRHTARLARSAAYFGYPFDEDRFRRRVERAALGTAPDTLLKVRATLDRWGRVDLETTPLSDEKEGPWQITVASARVDRSDPFLFHKTTQRAVYTRALQAARGEDFDEAILLNQEGHVTEGTYSNLFIREGESLLTPPVDSGLLAGVYREYVLEIEERATERVLTLTDLREADELYCCNAVRGWNRAVLTTPVTAS